MPVKSHEDSVYDIEKCIICQKITKTPLSSTENYRKKILDVGNKRRAEVYREHSEVVQISHDQWLLQVSNNVHCLSSVS